MAKPILTDADLTRALRDDRHNGHGFAEALRSGSTAPIDDFVACRETVIRLANERGWTYEQLFTWSDSKLGRWFGEAFFFGPDAPGISDRDVASTFKQP